jgi:hypothetical protein
MNNFYGCIYGLRSPINKWYIGQTTYDPNKYIHDVYRCRKGAGRPYINHAILKYGFDSFNIKIFVYLFDQESLNIAEIGFIEMFNSIKCGYNLSEGGSNHRMTDIQKKRISIALTGLKRSNEQRLNISKSLERFKYEVKDPYGNIHITTNLVKFCKEHKLSQSHLCSRFRSNGWVITSKSSLSLINKTNLVTL